MNKQINPGERRTQGASGKEGEVPKGKGEKPGWASGLRQLYDSVVDEPLPDSFSDLIAKLDTKN